MQYQSNTFSPKYLVKAQTGIAMILNNFQIDYLHSFPTNADSQCLHWSVDETHRQMKNLHTSSILCQLVQLPDRAH